MHKPGRQLQSQRKRPALAVRGKMLHRHATEQQGNILTVRTHQGHATLNLIVTTLRKTAHQSLLEVLNAHQRRMLDRALAHARKNSRLIVETDLFRSVCQPCVGAAKLRQKTLQQTKTRRKQLSTQGRQLLIPGRQGTQSVLVPRLTLHGFQQRITLPQNPLILATVPGDHRTQRARQIIHKTTTTGGITLHQLQILRGKQHRAGNTQRFLGTHRRGTINAHPVTLPRSNLKLGHRLLRTAHRTGTDIGARSTRPHQRPVIAHTVRRQRRRIVDRLNNIGFTHTVRAQKHRNSRRKRQAQQSVRAVIQQRNMVDIHRSSSFHGVSHTGSQGFTAPAGGHSARAKILWFFRADEHRKTAQPRTYPRCIGHRKTCGAANTETSSTAGEPASAGNGSCGHPQPEAHPDRKSRRASAHR